MLTAIAAMQQQITALANTVGVLAARSDETAGIVSRANLDNLRETLTTEPDPEELDAMHGFMRRFNQVWGDEWTPDEVFGVDPAKRAS